MSEEDNWSPYAKIYDPIQIGSIDGTDFDPHDKAILRAEYADYRPNRHVKGKPQCTIFVARLSPKTTKETIKEIFSRYGKIHRFRVVKDIVTGMPKGYAFVEYESESSAEEAYRKVYKMNVDGNELFIDFECERLLKGWKPRRLGGGFGGKKESGQLRFGGRDRPFMEPIVPDGKNGRRSSRRRSRSRERNGRSRHRSRSRSTRDRDDYKRRDRDDNKHKERDDNKHKDRDDKDKHKDRDDKEKHKCRDDKDKHKNRDDKDKLKDDKDKHKDRDDKDKHKDRDDKDKHKDRDDKDKHKDRDDKDKHKDRDDKDKHKDDKDKHKDDKDKHKDDKDKYKDDKDKHKDDKDKHKDDKDKHKDRDDSKRRDRRDRKK